MNKYFIILACALLAACQSHTEFGACVGINDKQDPTFDYRVSTRNVILGVIFVEAIIPPVVIVMDELYCPVSYSSTTRI